jgi:hypothetical protein
MAMSGSKNRAVAARPYLLFLESTPVHENDGTSGKSGDCAATEECRCIGSSRRRAVRSIDVGGRRAERERAGAQLRHAFRAASDRELHRAVVQRARGGAD